MNIENLDSAGAEYAVIDMDTGTVLGTNLRLVRMPQNEAISEEVLSSDSAAHDYAREHGVSLYFDSSR